MVNDWRSEAHLRRFEIRHKAVCEFFKGATLDVSQVLEAASVALCRRESNAVRRGVRVWRLWGKRASACVRVPAVRSSGITDLRARIDAKRSVEHPSESCELGKDGDASGEPPDMTGIGVLQGPHVDCLAKRRDDQDVSARPHLRAEAVDTVQVNGGSRRSRGMRGGCRDTRSAGLSHGGRDGAG
eukprot:scaffold1900_cov32-Tisochrysis_lutea.AAC.3